MEKKHTPRKVTQAQTTYSLSESEVTEALDEYIRSRSDIGVPNGRLSVWVNDRHSFLADRTGLDGGYASLVIDHEKHTNWPGGPEACPNCTGPTSEVLGGGNT